MIAEQLRKAAQALAAVSDTPRLDAELLMAHALGISREDLLLRRLQDVVPDAFAPLVARRLRHEPVAYITGRRAFWTIELEVGPGVLIPRPDSETLIEAAVAHFGSEGPRRVLDLGTGPGTLLLATLAEWCHASGIGVDASLDALVFARRNAERLGLADRARFARGNWADGISERFDLILCNPPYVDPAAVLDPQVRGWEPAEALFAGDHGLADYRQILPQLPPRLTSGGIACLELGAGQAEAVTVVAQQAGLAVRLAHDLAGHARCLVASVPE